MSIESAIGSEAIDLIIENIQMIDNKIDRAACLQILERNNFDFERTRLEVQQLGNSNSHSARSSCSSSGQSDGSEEEECEEGGIDDENEEDDEYEEALALSESCRDDYMDEEPAKPARMPMMPFFKCSESDAIACFGEEFSRRYGDLGGVIIAESLKDAVREAFEGPVLERKPLALYFHHDDSFITHIFCSQYLTDEVVLGFLAQNYTFWAWDLSNESKREELLELCDELREVYLEPVLSYSASRMPTLLLLSEADGRRAQWVSATESLDNNALHVTLMEFFDDHKLRAQYEHAVKSKQPAPPVVLPEQNLILPRWQEHDRAHHQLHTSEQETNQSTTSNASNDSPDRPDTPNEPDVPSVVIPPEYLQPGLS